MAPLICPESLNEEKSAEPISALTLPVLFSMITTAPFVTPYGRRASTESSNVFLAKCWNLESRVVVTLFFLGYFFFM